MKRYTVIAPVAFALFILAVTAAWVLAAGWSPVDNNLSDLGTSGGISGALFNLACVFCGAGLISYGLGMHCDMSKALYGKAGVCFIIGGAGLCAVGLAPASIQPWHDVACAVLMGGAGAGLFLATVADRDDRTMLTASAVLLVFTLIQWPFFRGAVSELMPIISASIWTVVFVWRHRREEEEESESWFDIME